MLATLSFILASTDAAVAAEHASSESLGAHFGIAPNYVAMQFISFCVVAFVFYRWGIKPVLAKMDERTTKIEEGLKDAAEMKTKLEAAQKDSEDILRRASLEAQAVINEARKTAKELADRQSQDTAAHTAAMLAKAQQAIELEHAKMLQEVRGEIARLVTLTTSQVLAKELSPEERTRYTQAATQELVKAER